MENRFKKIASIGFWIFCLLILIMILVSVIKFGSVIAFITIILWVIDKLEFEFGLNSYLANSFGILLAFLVTLSLMLILSKNRRKRLYGISLGTGLLILWNMTLFWIKADYNYDTQTGQPLLGFVYNDEGILEKIDLNKRYNPNDGTKILVPNSSIIKEYNLTKSGLPINSPVNVNKKTIFFDRFGTPNYYYYESKYGIEFFIRGGSHPRTGQPLIPVNEEIVQKYFLTIDKMKMQKNELSENKTKVQKQIHKRMPIKVTVSDENEFLLRQGKSMLYYSDSPAGIELFDGPGFHPYFGNKLEPVNSEIIRVILEDFERKTNDNENQIMKDDSHSIQIDDSTIKSKFISLRNLQNELKHLIKNK